MNVLLDTFALLANAMLDDPFLSLANAVAWLDPLWKLPEEYEYEEGREAEIALHITRSVFPDIYAGAIECVRAGTTRAQLDRYICSEISRLGIPLDDLETMPYGIPLPAHGVELAQPELYTERPDLARILALFGIAAEPDGWRVEVPDAAYTAGRLLVKSLVNQEDERWKHVGCALAWLFSCTGNSLVDWDYESLAEVEPLSWDEDDVAFAIEIIKEADSILKDVETGLAVLRESSAAFQILTENVSRVRQKLVHRKEQNHEPNIRMEWPPLDRGADGTAVAGFEFLQLRDAAAEARG